MKTDTPISNAESQLQAIESVWSRIFILVLVNWVGFDIGVWIENKEFLIWAGNPAIWVGYHISALTDGWGFIFVVLHAFIFLIWIFSDSWRFLLLITSFCASGLVVILLK